MPVEIDDLREIVCAADYMRDEGRWVCEVEGDNSNYCGQPAPWAATSRAADREALYDNGQYICEEHYNELGEHTMPRVVKCNKIKIQRRLPR